MHSRTEKRFGILAALALTAAVFVMPPSIEQLTPHNIRLQQLVSAPHQQMDANALTLMVMIR